MQQYEWFVGQVGDSVSLHFWRLQALGNTHLRGYVMKDGEMALANRVEIDISYDRDYGQRRYSASIVDSAGRETTVQTDVFARDELMPDSDFTLRESGGTAKIDGTHGVGWLECGWSTPYLRYITRAPTS